MEALRDIVILLSSIRSHWRGWNNQSYLFKRSFSKVGFPGSSDGKVSACNVGDPGSIPGLGRSPGEGNGNPLQYSYLENSMDRGAWWAAVHVVAQIRTWLSMHPRICVCMSYNRIKLKKKKILLNFILQWIDKSIIFNSIQHDSFWYLAKLIQLCKV